MSGDTGKNFWSWFNKAHQQDCKHGKLCAQVFAKTRAKQSCVIISDQDQNLHLGEDGYFKGDRYSPWGTESSEPYLELRAAGPPPKPLHLPRYSSVTRSYLLSLL